MSEKENSPIKLQLEEAIWLDQRAKNAQIVSLELVPDVDIVEDDYFVNIRGHLVLTGKYEAEEEEDSLDLESSSLAEQLQFDPLSVEPKEIYEQEYRGRIDHRFPFDVSVPASKVKNPEDIYVHIDQFDYTLSDGHRLQIKTEISITGIEQVQETEEKKPEQKVWSDFLPARKEVQEEGNDVRDEQRERKEEQAVKLNDQPSDVTQVRLEQASTEEHQEEQKEEQQENGVEQESREEEAQGEKQQEASSSEGEEQRVDEPVASPSPQEIKTTFSSRPEAEGPEVEEPAQAKEEEAEEEREEVKPEHRSKTVSFLSKLMENREDGQEEEKKRLRMCIIQQNETLEDISERYDISVYELMKANNLESDQVTKGQILYIPKS